MCLGLGGVGLSGPGESQSPITAPLDGVRDGSPRGLTRRRGTFSTKWRRTKVVTTGDEGAVGRETTRLGPTWWTGGVEGDVCWEVRTRCRGPRYRFCLRATLVRVDVAVAESRSTPRVFSSVEVLRRRCGDVKYKRATGQTFH